MLASLEYAKPLQHDAELAALIDLLTGYGVRSYLEVGARYGGSFERIVDALPSWGRGVAVDFPGGAFGDADSAAILLGAVARLRSRGRDVECIFGPSSAPEVRARVARRAPYDAVMIDADHAYAAVKKDFDLYAPLAGIVILHDIVHPADICSHDGRSVDVPRFWNEIKTRYPHREIVCEGSVMGIGVLFLHEGMRS